MARLNDAFDIFRHEIGSQNGFLLSPFGLQASGILFSFEYFVAAGKALLVPKCGIRCIAMAGQVCESRPAMVERTTPVLGELTARLSELAHSLWLNSDPVERLDLLKEFRIVLDLADEVIAREFPVESDHPATSEESLRLT